jgi:hypothetical protein
VQAALTTSKRGGTTGSASERSLEASQHHGRWPTVDTRESSTIPHCQSGPWCNALMPGHFRFLVHPERLAIARLAPTAELPGWARGSFVTVSRTPTELSVVCAEVHVPGEALCERGRVALGIVGTIPMTTVGVLASLCSALAAERVPVFVISTFDTDYLIVSEERLDEACRALRRLGHEVDGAVAS